MSACLRVCESASQPLSAQTALWRQNGSSHGMPMKRLSLLLILLSPAAAQAQRHIWIDVPYQRTNPGITYGGQTSCYGSTSSFGSANAHVYGNNAFGYGSSHSSGSSNCVKSPTFSTPATTSRYVLKVHVDCVDQTYDAKGDLMGWQSWNRDYAVYERAKHACANSSYSINNFPTSSASQPPFSNKSSSNYCRWNPWEPECQNGKVKPEKAHPACAETLKKFDCQYTKYLDANPHMKAWVKNNPEMARKEAMRLNAVDASKIGSIEKPPTPTPKTQEKQTTKNDCLKAADYKGCMEYHSSN